MRSTPLTRIELYAALLALKPKMDTFKATESASLDAHEVQLMADLYDDVRVLSHGQMANTLLTSCASCIREAMHVFISLFDRLAKDPDVNPDGVEEADEAGAANYNREQRVKMLEYLGYTLDEESGKYKREGLDDVDDEILALDEEVFNNLYAGLTNDLDVYNKYLKDVADQDLIDARETDKPTVNPEDMEVEGQKINQDGDLKDDEEQSIPVTGIDLGEAPEQVPAPPAVTEEVPVDGIPLNPPATQTAAQKKALQRARKKEKDAADAAKKDA